MIESLCGIHRKGTYEKTETNVITFVFKDCGLCIDEKNSKLRNNIQFNEVMWNLLLILQVLLLSSYILQTLSIGYCWR